MRLRNPHDCVSGPHMTRTQHAQVPTSSPIALHSQRHARCPEALVELPARLATLTDFEARVANLPPVTNANQGLVQPWFNAEVLAVRLLGEPPQSETSRA